MMATNDFTVVDYVLSPIYRFENLESESAVPSPYHPYHDTIKCDAGSGIKVVSEDMRIMPNKDYDDCVLGSGSTPGLPGLDKDKCPPG